MKKFGFIGCGNMGGTLAEAVAKSTGDTVYVSNHNADKAQALCDAINAEAVSNEEIAKECKYIFLGVKPQVFPELLESISDILKSREDRFVLISMAAGLTLESVSEMAKGDYPIIRIMPNTPAAVGMGLILYCINDRVTEDETEEFASSLKTAGETDEISESLIDAASAVSGCGPAFAYMFIEAMSDGGVKCGLPREKALKYAARTLLGASEMVLKSGMHPGELKDAVCSPKGSTIAGVEALEKNSFRSASISAVVASFERTKELGKK